MSDDGMLHQITTDSITCGLQLPGFWIDHQDREWASSTRELLSATIDQLDEAALVLQLFNEATTAETESRRGVPVPGPPSTARRLRHLYAKSFVYALDAAFEIVKKIGKVPALPTSAQVQCRKLRAEFAHLRDIRNSLHHIEDRLLAQGPNGKPIPSSVIVIAGFLDNRISSTGASGRHTEIEISQRVLERVCGIVRDLMWSFEWLIVGNQRVRRPATV